MPIIQKYLGMRERDTVCPHLIVSKEFSDETGWFNYLHQDNDFGSISATHKAIKLIEQLYCEKAYCLKEYF